MLQVEGVRVGIVFKVYDNGRITGMIRCNPGAEIGHTLAAHFGGGGHPYASGFKISGGKPFNEIKSECIKVATELLEQLERGK
jgi:nanoRNase/pAp phosphatase (c-di-AMP/oligoRNAs hydrolase)